MCVHHSTYVTFGPRLLARASLIMRKEGGAYFIAASMCASSEFSHILEYGADARLMYTHYGESSESLELTVVGIECDNAAF